MAVCPLVPPAPPSISRAKLLARNKKRSEVGGAWGTQRRGGGGKGWAGGGREGLRWGKGKGKRLGGSKGLGEGSCYTVVVGIGGLDGQQD